MKNSKPWLIVAIAVPLLLGGYLLYRYFQGPNLNKKQDFDSKKLSSVKPLAAATPSVFPLKNGSPKNDLVKQLQQLLGVIADGLFGPKTAAALLLKAGKTSIASQADFDAVISKLTAAAVVDAAKNASTQRADKLVSDWQSNSSLKLLPIDNVKAYGFVEDAYGALQSTGSDITLIKGQPATHTDIDLTGSSQNGFLKLKMLSGGMAGKTYKIDPSKISLA